MTPDGRFLSGRNKQVFASAALQVIDVRETDFAATQHLMRDCTGLNRNLGGSCQLP